ncbi:MAG: TIGR03862 family flavoprotein [Alphaproteobacteria bacterium]
MPTVAVVGGGPAGLIAAEVLSAAGVEVVVHDRMPSVGRKLLMAGRGGLNLTHSEPPDAFLARYGAAAERLAPAIAAFPPAALRAWADGLGQATFVGSSGRVFPQAMKASPLLRAWLARLAAAGVRFRLRSRWQGWDPTGRLVFATSGGIETAAPDATLLALGGASWPRLGADGGWVPLLAARGVRMQPLVSANCGFAVDWSEGFRSRFAGVPLKGIGLAFAGRAVRGEAVVTAYGVEGGAVYALSAALRDAIAREGRAVASFDLRPEMSVDALRRRLERVGAAQSASSRLRKAAGLAPVAVNLLREAGAGALPRDAEGLARLVKAVPVTVTAPQPLARAISTAGGIALDEIDDAFMLHRLPGVFVAGEMLDWEAPTGGYLLQACFATGVAAARGILGYLGCVRFACPSQRG